MADIEVFHFDETKESFENHSNENGFTYWSARKLMECLGYLNWNTFNQVISKAMTTCNTLNIPIMGNFEARMIELNGKLIPDFKLSRFACYLVSMNGNIKMPQVAKAQAYFAALAGAVQDYQIEAEKVERLQIRGEVSERESTLSGVAFSAGVKNYAFFQNAGYMGMYNKNIKQLKLVRRIDEKRSLLDFMGKDELAANLFRITQTELKIRNENVSGQSRLESAAHTVGRQVRQAMIDINNITPEQLPIHDDIKQVKKELKEKNKALKSFKSKGLNK
ncbi:MAG: hypothetical protein AAGC65_18555 [Mucilaginibacter sp.]|uniref:hypothetical protein n=1 Tax=Mucilaginibacter sp. TaxID=1882438 RepID=UPI0031ABBDFB